MAREARAAAVGAAWVTPAIRDKRGSTVDFLACLATELGYGTIHRLPPGTSGY